MRSAAGLTSTKGSKFRRQYAELILRPATMSGVGLFRQGRSRSGPYNRNLRRGPDINKVGKEDRMKHFSVQSCEVSIYKDHVEACQVVAEEIIQELASSAGDFLLNIAGGTTILGVWKLLVEESGRLEWERLVVFQGDEHIVGPQSDQNNFYLVWPYLRQLFEQGLLLPQQLHRIPVWNGKAQRPFTLAEAQRAAAAYAAEIEAAGGHFDLSILGLGADAHTASLLPGIARTILESERLVEAAAYGSDIRITLTPKAFRLSDRVIMLVTGEKKAKALYQVLTAQEIDLQKHPGQMIRLLPNASVVADRAAAALLEDLSVRRR